MNPEASPLVQALLPYSFDQVIPGREATFSFLPGGVFIDARDEDGLPRETLTWSVDQKNDIRGLLEEIETLIDLDFREVPANSRDISIEFAQISRFSDLTTGLFIPQGVGQSLIVVERAFATLDEVTLIHEIGHAIGLSHPFDGFTVFPGLTSPWEPGDYTLNSELATRMSYRPGEHHDFPGLDITGEGRALGALDIATLQLIYGANETTAAGDTSYRDTEAMRTIWDTGGTDIIDFSGARDDAVIDLRAATLAIEPGGGGYLSFIGRDGGTLAQGGYTIAHGVEIENARGGQGDDWLWGNDGDNVLSGFAGDDWFYGGLGDDSIYGGNGGLDTAAYVGPRDNYTLTVSADRLTIEDRRADGEGTDRLTDIEALTFGDAAEAPFALSDFTGAVALDAADMRDFVSLYIAYFDRAPDAVGLNFWGTAHARGTSLEEMARLFNDQSETRAEFGLYRTEGELVQGVYGNVLGRSADAAGFAFWTDALERGAVSRDQFILSLLEGARAAPPPGADASFVAQQAADRRYLDDKIDIGTYFAVIRGFSDLGMAQQVMDTFDGSAASLAEAKALVDEMYTIAMNATSGGGFLMPLVGVMDDPFAGLA